MVEEVIHTYRHAGERHRRRFGVCLLLRYYFIVLDMKFA